LERVGKTTPRFQRRQYKTGHRSHRVNCSSLNRRQTRLVTKYKKSNEADKGEHSKLRTDAVAPEEKRFDNAAPKSLTLLGGEQIQNVSVHQLKGLTSPSGDTSEWVFSNEYG